MSSSAALHDPILPQNEQSAAVWNSGGRHYDRISRQIADAIEHCVDRLDPQPDETILDLATGTGWTARRVKERESFVTGVDISATAITTAWELDPQGEILFQIGDAESLALATASFDAVISTFGVMFCNDSESAAKEIARVCRPGGRMALAIWDATGGVYDMFRMISRYQSKKSSSGSSPFDWSDEQRLHQLFGRHFDLSVERAVSYYRERTPEEAWLAFSKGYGPLKMLLANLNSDSAKALQEEFIAFHEEYRTPLGILVPRPYLIVSGTRNDYGFDD